MRGIANNPLTAIAVGPSGSPSELICRLAPGDVLNPVYLACEFKSQCMNRCGCSTRFMAGFYHRIGAFFCTVRKSAMHTAQIAFEMLERRRSPCFLHHLSGQYRLDSRAIITGTRRENTVGREAFMQSEKPNNKEQTCIRKQ